MQMATRLLSLKGRASRAEFWAVHLLTVPVQLLLIISLLLVGGSGDDTPHGVITLNAFSWAKIAATFAEHQDKILLVLLLPLPLQMAAGARRMHDRDRSAWWVALFLGPVLLTLALNRLAPSTESGPSELTIAAVLLAAWYFFELGVLEGSPGLNAYSTAADIAPARTPEVHEMDHHEPPPPDRRAHKYSAAEAAIDRAVAALAMAADAGKAPPPQPVVERRQGDRRQGDRRVGMPDTREVKIERRSGVDRRAAAAAASAGANPAFGRRRTDRPA